MSIRHIYGEPVHHGDTTVIPVAKVAYAFGAGGGERPGHTPRTPPDESLAAARFEVQGGGGGGGVRMMLVGALEIGPGGTRFVHVYPLTPWFGAGALGLVIGWFLARRR